MPPKSKKEEAKEERLETSEAKIEVKKSKLERIEELENEIRGKMVSRGQMVTGGSYVRSQHLREISETSGPKNELYALYRELGIPESRFASLRP